MYSSSSSSRRRRRRRRRRLGAGVGGSARPAGCSPLFPLPPPPLRRGPRRPGGEVTRPPPRPASRPPRRGRGGAGGRAFARAPPGSRGPRAARQDAAPAGSRRPLPFAPTPRRPLRASRLKNNSGGAASSALRRCPGRGRPSDPPPWGRRGAAAGSALRGPRGRRGGGRPHAGVLGPASRGAPHLSAPGAGPRAPASAPPSAHRRPPGEYLGVREPELGHLRGRGLWGQPPPPRRRLSRPRCVAGGRPAAQVEECGPERTGRYAGRPGTRRRAEGPALGPGAGAWWSENGFLLRARLGFENELEANGGAAPPTPTLPAPLQGHPGASRSCGQRDLELLQSLGRGRAARRPGVVSRPRSPLCYAMRADLHSGPTEGGPRSPAMAPRTGAAGLKPRRGEALRAGSEKRALRPGAFPRAVPSGPPAWIRTPVWLPQLRAPAPLTAAAPKEEVPAGCRSEREGEVQVAEKESTRPLLGAPELPHPQHVGHCGDAARIGHPGLDTGRGPWGKGPWHLEVACSDPTPGTGWGRKAGSSSPSGTGWGWGKELQRSVPPPAGLLDGSKRALPLWDPRLPGHPSLPGPGSRMQGLPGCPALPGPGRVSPAKKSLECELGAAWEQTADAGNPGCPVREGAGAAAPGCLRVRGFASWSSSQESGVPPVQSGCALCGRPNGECFFVFALFCFEEMDSEGLMDAAARSPPASRTGAGPWEGVGAARPLHRAPPALRGLEFPRSASRSQHRPNPANESRRPGGAASALEPPRAARAPRLCSCGVPALRPAPRGRAPARVRRRFAPRGAHDRGGTGAARERCRCSCGSCGRGQGPGSHEVRGRVVSPHGRRATESLGSRAASAAPAAQVPPAPQHRSAAPC
ncbi:collagen alpha-1(I) chain-like [Lepus europaeus]|uniref:collagen alpha-1(I) chain-like n=1 Tax=Lepus europaeus TaxID=9983 RepID=UPI002B466166|nr:collagen alpha-1(I) chain-like [Lepus europaeus]